MNTVIRIQDVSLKTGLPRSTIYRMISDGKFPRQFKLSVRSSGWLVEDIDKWIATRVSNIEIKDIQPKV